MEQNIIGILILIYALCCWLFDYQTLRFVLLELFISALFFGISVSFYINKDFLIKKRIEFFGVVFLSWKIKLDFPDYISVFLAMFKHSDFECGEMIGTHKQYVVLFFKERKRFILYKTFKYDKALAVANELGQLLNVEIHDTIKTNS